MDKPKFDGIEKYIFADVYMFLTAYIDGDGSDQFWERCTADARRICNKYKNYQLCNDMIITSLMDIEFKVMGTTDKNGMKYIDWEAFKNSVIKG